MKIKNLILSVALILGSCSDAVLVAQAKSNASELKKALHCIRNWKQCDRKQRVKVVGYLSAALAGAAAVGVASYVGLKRGQRPVEAAVTPRAAVVAEPAVPVPAVAEKKEALSAADARRQARLDRQKREAEARKAKVQAEALQSRERREVQQLERLKTTPLALESTVRRMYNLGQWTEISPKPLQSIFSSIENSVRAYRGFLQEKGVILDALESEIHSLEQSKNQWKERVARAEAEQFLQKAYGAARLLDELVKEAQKR